MDELKYHRCERDDRRPLIDAQGIFLDYVCDECEAAKRSKYRPEVLTGYTQADVDAWGYGETIEPEDEW